MEISPNLYTEQISKADCLQDFFCGIKPMDDFIHGRFQLSISNNFCKAYVVKDKNQKILAMFALSFDSIDLDSDDKEELQDGISSAERPSIDPDYEDTFYLKRRYPALEIAYLAVRKDVQKQGLGSAIVQLIINKALQQDIAGCQFLSVEALAMKEYNAVSFYLKCGFAPNELPNPNKDTLRMFKTLPLVQKSR